MTSTQGLSPLTMHGTTHDAVAFPVPAGACDCHTHVFGPAERYPLAADRHYTPGEASAEELQAFHRHLGIERVVIVHPSPYGADNACTVDALLAIGKSARGVAVISRTTSDDELSRMHAAGTRGVRINLETAGVTDPDYAASQIQWTAARIAPLGWHLQMYARPELLASVAGVIRTLQVPLVADHFARVPARLGSDQAHLGVLLDLVASGKLWVKLSAPQRSSDAPDCADAGVIAKAFIDANPDRMLWGSDWPHPGARAGVPRRIDTVEPFNPVNDGRALNRLAEWVNDYRVLTKILVHNPAELYDF
jgi:predicted TIM-barrel fold metal-dependent hydrolase